MSQSAPQTVDLLIEARWVVPVVPHDTVLEQHAVAVDGDRIVGILPIAEARVAYAPRARVELGEHVLIPGLINTHTHNPMSLLRGLADDLPLMVWLQQHIWPVEAKVIGPEFVRDGVELSVAEMIRGGTTCANENYFFPDAIGATYHKLGFRAVVGLPVIQFPTAWARTQDEYFERAGEVHDSFRHDPLVRTAFAPHAPYTVSDESFERIRVLADQLDIPVHLHLHETAHEVEEERQKSGLRPFQRLQKLGLINDRLIAVHMTQLTEGEIAACAEAGVSVVHCPESNLKLASGFCPAEQLRKAGVNVAVGTDGCASNNDLDMFGEMRTAALLAKAVASDAAAFDAGYALRTATINAARALGLEASIGSIEAGKQADLAAVRLSDLETQPLYHVISQLVYATGRHQVSDVWIAGKRKLAARELVDLDMPGILARTHAWRERIAALDAV
ncbi:TRZ/ATZ family hydrolase [Dyella acidiphila]|uniref:TRZ/ATZ family hydrolase n=1 Tax=Dyella acidiphila TaxID=2775866 RepID=A0ABR9G7G8_9GAMM|nr:TRZ/ATZ family hydrolase [Dyella acidiphila]MBE1159994.1 TRZ/ATZ family hydrolase [Dyella acidiphila]